LVVSVTRRGGVVFMGAAGNGDSAAGANRIPTPDTGGQRAKTAVLEAPRSENPPSGCRAGEVAKAEGARRGTGTKIAQAEGSSRAS